MFSLLVKVEYEMPLEVSPKVNRGAYKAKSRLSKSRGAFKDAAEAPRGPAEVLASQSFQDRNFLMANPEENQEHGWIGKVKSEGSVPLLEPDHCQNGWAFPSGDVFKVRGPGYLTTKAKIPGSDYLLKPLSFDWIKGPMKISEILNNTKSHVRRALDDEISKDHKKPFIWAFNLQVPMVANAIVHLAFGYITTLTVDLAFLIEGQTELELPERILGTIRFSKLNTASANQVELHYEKSMEYLQSSLPTRFWKSLGQGFSQLIKLGGQEKIIQMLTSPSRHMILHSFPIRRDQYILLFFVVHIETSASIFPIVLIVI
ncbi:Hypothetical predicted protein [Olea europaea subsp. europaea]|uniref:Protein ENHANCED DISEASE RESISTANCE 2 C-terminal domain-containing protein n=1 Tax=Olea europaea subsp. europaea TaxID=158383 RepID=A0A8S0QDF4_OLEEU|nr:Hypothetical predicted protein [Olea europaea subsp. europaea]